MATLEDATALASALPEVEETTRYGHRSWAVRRKVFAWERPFSKADLKRFGDETPPSGPILAITTADLHEKEAIIAAGPGVFFTIPHFDNYAAVLLRLDAITKPALREAIVDGWLACAPDSLAATYRDRS
ncbi:hypothetical protein GIS00_08545 [Nakamurella sp. YIM 132087]|uniref:MmcQ/YjbR family DNA-binding protein n=1 Tax=Nakamurella alba TaxID=2665158 RepID=A0A7K1FIP0_9ACTN|nr:hypothetical protein [Nakamurella alba]MTD13991.1 hypothetical protein [Nakamurella alba]